MSTKLSCYATRVMEAAWLAAVILVPAFFNVYSSRIFEPDKLTLLRSIALVILAAWLIKIIEDGGIHWERLARSGSSWKSLLKTPFVAPVLALAAIYIISTIFSINPRTSLWGSYQRLQGTYTTFSYLVVFAALAANLRSRAQVERLITTVIITSLPVSLYGVLQRYKIDPVPWGGDVTRRIASNMGNSIFVAAYLIMVNPLTMIRIFGSFRSILRERAGLTAHMARSTTYVFIAALQLIALFFTGSRGPWLGWAAGSFFMLVILSLVWRKRWLTVGVVVLAILGAAFLVTLNLPGSPLAGLREIPGVGRLGQLLDAESRTGRVRTLIWQGAAELVQPHQALEFPDGHKDPFNLLRPLIGYGPEGMYVAYNPFYPPELTQVEKRNASPDRSHNETWDALVITGLFGLLAYLSVFASVIYFSLKWLGLINDHRQRNLFLALFIGTGVTSAAGFVIWRGASYFGVGLPFGCIIGTLVYLTIAALFGHYQTPATEGQQLRALTLIGLLAVVVAHFVEINFGIAIAVTRTYFWAFAGLLLLVGYILPLYGEYEGSRLEAPAVPVTEPESSQVKTSKAEAARRKKRHPTRQKPVPESAGWPLWLRDAIISGTLIAILLAALGYNFISPSKGIDTALGVVWNSLARLRSTSSPISYGMLAMVLTTWLFAGILLPSEEDHSRSASDWTKSVGITLGLSLLLGFFYWLLHAGALIRLVNTTLTKAEDILPHVDRFGGLLTGFYIYIFLLIFAGAAALTYRQGWPTRFLEAARLGAVVAPFAALLVMALISTTNLRIVQADIAFKQADAYVKQGAWPVAITIYNHANDLAPTEDYYYLFLGRAYLEYGRTLDDAAEREKLIAQARSDLEKAQTLNPLNIDHTANLARLHSLWSLYTNDAALKKERADKSSEYFSRALVLSPNSARLWDEWATLFINAMKEPEAALERLKRSLEIDPYYDWTYALLGDYYSRQAQGETDLAAQENHYREAVTQYEQALSLVKASDTDSKYNYAVALASVYVQLKELQPAIANYAIAMQTKPKSSDIWRIEETLTRLYFQLGEPENALIHANNAYIRAPKEQQERLKSIIDQIEGQGSTQPQP